MTLSEYFEQKSNGLIRLNPEVRDEGKGYLMFDDGGVEAEVGEFLHGLVRVLKPVNIFESGTYTGISSMYMAQALKDNKNGHLLTCEINDFHKQRAEELWRRVGVNDFVSCKLINSLDMTIDYPIDLLFLDSEPDVRFKELVKFYPQVSPGGYIFIHDLHRHLGQETIPGHEYAWPFGIMPEEVKNWLRDRDLAPFYLPTPRGISGFYKQHPSDYKIV